MKPKTLLVLTLLALVLGAFIVFVERDLPSTDERRESEGRIFGDLEVDKVVAVELRAESRAESGADSRAEGEVVRLEKVTDETDEAAETDSESEDDPLFAPPAEWRIVAPIEARADAEAVRSLVERLAALEKERTIEDFDAGELGLDAPRGTVVLETKAKKYSLRLGADLPLGDGSIVLGDDPSQAYATNAGDLASTIGRAPSEWRDRSLFPGRRAEVERIALDPVVLDPVVLTRRGDGETFVLERPIEDAADRDLVAGLLGALVSLEAESFLDPATHFEPAGRVEIRLEGRDDDRAEPWTIELAESGATARVTPPGELVAIEAEALRAALARDAEAWRSRAWTTTQVFQVDRALVTFPETGESFELSREDGEWYRDGEAIEYTVATNVLYPPTETRAEELVDRATAESRGHDLAAPRLEITLESGDSREILRLFDTVGDRAAALAEGRDAVLLVPAVDADALVEAAEAVRPAAGS